MGEIHLPVHPRKARPRFAELKWVTIVLCAEVFFQLRDHEEKAGLFFSDDLFQWSL